MSSFLSELIIRRFGEDPHAVEVGLNDVGASLLWLNPHVSELDPAFERLCGSDMGRYEDHILRSCSVSYVMERSGPFDHVGFFDRYGGEGVGKNGGSGRAVNVNGYNVKGVGRSPLVSHRTDFAHASGYAFLEEALREVIMYLALREVLPFGASPIFAILGLDEVIEWPEGSFPPRERRVLIVRPQSGRLAHLETASSYVPKLDEERRIDRSRVAAWRTAIQNGASLDAAFTVLGDVFERWGYQYAACLTSHWTLGGLSPSNIDVDGKILDFGGASQVSSMANFAVGYSAWSWTELRTIQRSASSISTGLRGLAKRVNEPVADAVKLFQKATDAFYHGIARELLSVVPTEAVQFVGFLNTAEGANVWEVVDWTIRLLEGVRVPIDGNAGPTRQALTGALEELSFEVRPFSSEEQFLRYMNARCATATKATFNQTFSPSYNRETIRRKLHRRILDLGPPSASNVSDLLASMGTRYVGRD